MGLQACVLGPNDSRLQPLRYARWLNDTGLHTYMEGSVDVYKEAGGLDLYAFPSQAPFRARSRACPESEGHLRLRTRTPQIAGL
jgi:hypothetical protein